MAAPFLCREDSRKAAKGMRFPVRKTGICILLIFAKTPGKCEPETNHHKYN